ncbi:MAG: peptidoglycan-binding protein [Candidatus Pacebacteria bacterium]|nr:peptidoglycan-binding protein [Candidatus Paceibacterota bacterium]
MIKQISFKKSKTLLASVVLFVCTVLPLSQVEARTVTISTVSPNTTVAVGTGVSFTVKTDDYVRLNYTISDSLSGSTISNSSINTAGVFSWTPIETDIGVHSLTITTTDPLGSRNTYYQTLTITEASPVKIVSLSPGSSVFPNKGVSFGVSAPGYINPTFSLFDSFVGGNGATTISSRNIDSFGNVNWTPKESDVGIHNISIRVSASNGRQDTVYQTIVVNGISMRDIYAGSISTAYTDTAFNFATNLYGFNYPTYSLSDSFGNSTLDSVAINVNSFGWKPQSQDIGRHTITITAVEDVNVAKTQLVVDVVARTNSSAVVPTVTPSEPSSTVSTKPQTSSAGNYVFKKALSFGSKGAEVIELQKKLKTEGVYSGPTNGSFGPLTKAAVIKYQALHKISKLGIVGPATRAALNK